MAGRWVARFAQGRHRSTGIDVGADEVRVVVLSRRGRVAEVRIEGLEREPVGLAGGPEDARWAAVARGLAAAVSRLSAADVRCEARGVMALHDDEMRTATLDLAGRDDVADAARQAAERISGLAPDSLAFDWRQDGGAESGEIAVAVAPLALLERRIDVAAQAGVDLAAVDGESAAALRALRYAAQFELDAQGAYAALWFGDSGVHGWRIDGPVAAPVLALSGDVPGAFSDALRRCALGAVRCVLVAGDERCIARFGTSVADIGDLLGAVAVPFDCMGWSGQPCSPDGMQGGPAFAVAFGLALRGVWE
ncbi:competence protein ComA [Burkholderia stabilis]|uniref:competence protein ComA n=1 Tax=Burkholderia stabilis TaxID=95485 RepID=UPI0015897483|nr:competence protein ComA [Burkholderia stabilis]HDR9495621.1 competence protein ComA [Burkholderia stabilis]HDR9527235.1 competence protein ComA [Burkholderia stabilis]HDR9533799.1 competence protein ComA [Burkholderia stabilis]HDR9540501.1 competence protein ComA [Burkholderia stabilis]HDR9547847.1 competence protein ComA [Burkholderia stabilis]